MTPCEVCGLPLEVGQFGCITTIRPHGPARMRVISDGIPGGMVIENLGPTPQKFDSWSKYREATKAAHVVNAVKHTPLPGSDKSPYTSRWI